MDSQIQQVIDQLFPSYDRNNSGCLDSKELCGFLVEALKRLNIRTTISEVQAQQALSYIDKNSDGTVNRMEVFQALKSIVEFKRSKGGPSPGPQMPQQNNGWGQTNPTPNNFNQNNGWGPSPQQQPRGPWDTPPQPNNGWGQPSQPSNNWGSPQQNNWGPPQPNNAWGSPQQPTHNYGGWGGQQQPQNNEWRGVSFTTSQDQQLKGMVDRLYSQYDRDRSGCMDRSELTQAFNQLLQDLGVPLRITQYEADALLQQVDSSNDGKIQKPEFFRMLKMLLAGTEQY